MQALSGRKNARSLSLFATSLHREKVARDVRWLACRCIMTQLVVAINSLPALYSHVHAYLLFRLRDWNQLGSRFTAHRHHTVWPVGERSHPMEIISNLAIVS